MASSRWAWASERYVAASGAGSTAILAMIASISSWRGLVGRSLMSETIERAACLAVSAEIGHWVALIAMGLSPDGG
jgi:hypothetical protein